MSRKDVDAALAALEAQLTEQFALELEDPDNVPPGTTVFPETAVLGEPAPTVDPDDAHRAGGRDRSRSCLTAEGTVTAVDSTPVEAIAEDALAAAVDPGSELVRGLHHRRRRGGDRRRRRRDVRGHGLREAARSRSMPPRCCPWSWG